MKTRSTSRFRFVLFTSPLSYLALFLICTFVIGFIASITGLELPADPSGRLAILGQPIMVWMPALFPLYLIVLILWHKPRKTPPSKDS